MGRVQSNWLLLICLPWNTLGRAPVPVSTPVPLPVPVIVHNPGLGSTVPAEPHASCGVPGLNPLPGSLTITRASLQLGASSLLVNRC